MSQIKELILDHRNCYTEFLRHWRSDPIEAGQWEEKRLAAYQRLRDAMPMDWIEAREKARELITASSYPDELDLEGIQTEEQPSHHRKARSTCSQVS